MIKKMFSLSLLTVAALTAQAYEVGDFAYTKVAKYQITGANLVVNGQFTEGATGTDGWNPIDETLPVAGNFLWVKAGGPNGQNAVQVATGMNALTNGMYQKVTVDAAGTYIVSFKVKGAAAGFTDLDLTGGSINYMNAYYNTDEHDSLATCGGTNNMELYYGTDGVNGGYQFSFTADGYTEVNFAVEAPSSGYITIDFRGMVDGLSIADVCCHAAQNVYDDRLVNDRIAYLQNYLNDENAESKEGYEGLAAALNELKAGIEANVSADHMAAYMENVDVMWGEYTAANFENMMDIINGGSEAGNNSCNWMYWTDKYNKLISNYNGTAPWTWSTDRWAHKTAAANSPLMIQWMRGVGTNSNWNNIATLTTELSAGTYYWGVTGQGGMMTLNKYRWVRSWANECAETKLFFNGDTITVDTLNPARNQDYVLQFTLDEKKEVTLGIICNNVSTLSENCGFDVQFYNPVLYKVKDGGLTETQKLYLKAVDAQLEALAGRLDVAYGYLSEANDTLPWGKETLQEGTTVTQARYDAWMAMTQEEILASLDNYVTLADTIMNNGRYFLNDYITSFINTNAPLTELSDAIDNAREALNKRVYSSSSKMDELSDRLLDMEDLYYELLHSSYSEENAATVINQRLALETLVEEFKEAIAATTLVDIDFGTQEAPAVFVEHEVTEGLAGNYYTIDGAVGSMKFTSIATDLDALGWELGYGSTTDEVGTVIHTDSLGMLRVGNSEAVVDLGEVNAEIVNIKFDFYFGNLHKKYAGFKVLTEAGDTVCGLYCSKYSATDMLNTFGIDYFNNITAVGSSASSNAAIAAATNKTSFDIVLDYGIGKMYCTTSGAKGTFTTEEIDITAGLPSQFVVYSNYNFGARRCWFDNLKIQAIGTSYVQPKPNNVFGVEFAEVFKGSTFSMPVSLVNDTEISAFQCDVYLSDGLTLNLNDEGEYDVTLNAARKTSSHSVATSLQSDGAIRIISYSTSNKAFKGNSGELFNLNLTALDEAGENQTVEIRNIRVSTADETEYSVANAKATVTVKSYTPADVNGDGQITIVDVVAVVNALMGTTTENFIFDAADMDQNGEITIVDVVAVVNALMGNSTQALTARSILHSDIHVADAEVNAGETTTLYVKLDHAQAYTAMQMDVNLPEGLSIDGVKMVGNPSHTVVCNEKGRIAAYSLSNSRFNDGETLMAITVKANKTFVGTAQADFTNVRVVSTDMVETMLADASASIAGGGADGIDGVTTDENVQVLYYSTTGAVSGTPHKGLNIIKRIYQDDRVEVNKEMYE